LDDVLKAANELGVPTVEHFNNSNDQCAGYFQVNQSKGWRLSCNTAFLKPVRHRKNLTVISQALAKRVVFTNNRAVGVEYLDKSNNVQVLSANKECILAAGAIGSAQLLQISGVGPQQLLQKHNIDVVRHMPGVGQNLSDHLQIRSIYRLKEGTKTLNQSANSILGRIKMGLQYMAFQTGALSMAPSQAGMFLKSSPDQSSPNLQYHFQPLSLDKFGDPLHNFPAITLSVCNLRPTSRGSVSITSADCKTAPVINPNYLSTATDRAIAAQSIQWSRKLMRTQSFSKYDPLEYLPGSNIESDDELVIAAGNISTSIFHPVGTCKMGPSTDSNAVVDDRLKVHGILGLRVADASIMPDITSGNTNSPTIMIAEKASDLIKQDNA
jgi:choline dehydrogenase